MSLSEFRGRDAYVLLGDPGLGKTTSFRMEAKAAGQSALFLTARDFVAFDPADQPAWQGKMLFIDGLDEIRAGGNDLRKPLDRIRENLNKLGRPKFRISCRHADWLLTDHAQLKKIAPSGGITLLNLDPLNRDSAIELLEQNCRIGNGAKFYLDARERGMEAMLSSPQTLEMLAKTVSEQGWPSNRTELFDQACQFLAREFNEEHLDAGHSTNVQQILDTTGRICALLLLSDTTGCNTLPGSEETDYPYIDIADTGIETDSWRAAISTKLFSRESNRVECIHRNIAEFLAARLLSALIEDGLPAARIVSNMTDARGNVFSHLRGLSAWLAVHSQNARKLLIARDPVGVGLYGDIENLSSEDRSHLFQSLVQDPIQLRPTYRMAKTFSSLVVRSMHEVLVRTLRSPPGDTNSHIVVEFILYLFAESDSIPEMQILLTNFVRDESQPSSVKEAAVEALIAHTRRNNLEESLVPLLADVKNSRVNDPDGEILGNLLAALYPKWVPASKLWDFWRIGKDKPLGAYHRFWNKVLPVTSSVSDVALLLDECAVRKTQLSKVRYLPLRRCISRLLIRGLQSHGDVIDTPRLYQWLNVGIELGAGIAANWAEDGISIRQWIESRPHLHSKIFLQGICQPIEKQGLNPQHALKRLFGSALSTEFLKECIELVIDLDAEHSLVAETVLRFFIRTRQINVHDSPNLVVNRGKLDESKNDLLVPAQPSVDKTASKSQHIAIIEQSLQNIQKEYEALKKHESTMLQGTAKPIVLHKLATVYFDDFLNYCHENAMSRINALALFDESLQEAIRTGLLQVAARVDLPSVDETLQLTRESKMHYLSMPLLASFAIAEEDEQYDLNMCSDDQLRKALGVYFSCAHGSYMPAWYCNQLRDQPVIVAEVQLKITAALLNDGVRRGNAHIRHLALHPAHATVAGIVALPLLKKFPILAKKEMLSELEYLLIAAHHYAEVGRFREVIETKLALPSMPVRQRARWLAAGCIVALDEFGGYATDFVRSGRTQTRLLDFLSFFCRSLPRYSPLNSSDLRVYSFVFTLSATFVSPEQRGDFSTTDGKMSRHFYHSFESIARNPSVKATELLDSLLQKPNLSKWHEHLLHCIREQKQTRADHEYNVPTLKQMVDLLDNGLPSNPTDLATLLMSHLEAFNENVQARDSDDWRQFWNEDGYGRPTCPKPENSCTKVILGKLRDRLPDKISVEFQGSYSRGTSADLKVIHDGFNVPIEAKCSKHSELWNAARSQLQTKYTIDPTTSGVGIYLVYWFGRRYTKPSPQGTQPSTSEQLQRQLNCILTEEERRKIFVYVIDVSEKDVD